MGTQPEVMREQIAQTRRELGADLDALQDKVSPHNVVERQKTAAKGRLVSARERVMGAKDAAASSAQSAKDSAASGAGDRLHSAEQSVQDTAQGHPLVAGALAFGAGYLLSALLPSTKAEQQAGSALKEQGRQHQDTVKQELSSVAQDVKQDVSERVSAAKDEITAQGQSAAQHVKEQAGASGQEVAGDAKSAAQETKGQAQDSAHQVKDSAQSPSPDRAAEPYPTPEPARPPEATRPVPGEGTPRS